MTDRVVVTGGAGFVGSELVAQLAAQGRRVVVIDDLINGRRENLADLPADLVELVVADVRDEDRMRELVRGAAVVFHLAVLGVRHSIHSPRENHEVNATATLRLLVAAREAGVPRFVYVSSSEVYGHARHVPMSEDHPAFPTTVYGASKLAGEGYARAFFTTYGYPTVVVRPFNAYGPRSHHEGDSGEVVPRFLLHSLARRPMVVFGDGKQTRDFTYVTDTARGILAAGLVEGVLGETINLGSGREIAIRDLAREVARVAEWSDAKVEHDAPRPGDVRRLYADTTKAKRLLRFEPTVTLRDGLVRLRDWYRASGRSPEVLLEEEISRNWERAAS